MGPQVCDERGVGLGGLRGERPGHDRVRPDALRAEFRSLFAGAKLDQERARKLVDEKTAAVQAGSPEVIAAAADFFDNLNPAQQQKVRDFMDRPRWGRRG